ncbi:MAG: fimbrial protein [Scandinavium sp.]|uniref:fimbrial protein n=1 Tax=Scandinavium sp. TaxID=2830653 RepID=UPI003F340675
MKVVIKIFLAVVLTGSSGSLWANCRYINGAHDIQQNLNIGDITIKQDVSVGSEVFRTSVKFQPYGQGVMRCILPPEWVLSSGVNNIAVSGSPAGTYQTGIPGYSVIVYAGTSNSEYTYQQPPFTRFIAHNNITALDDLAEATLIIRKTGQSEPGTVRNLPTGLYAEFSTVSQDGSLFPVRLNVTGGRIITTGGCMIKTPDVTVMMGNFAVKQFRGVGSTTPEKEINMLLECQAMLDVSVTLSGMQNSETSDTSVLQLNGAGSAEVATGVGIQVLYGTEALKLNEKKLLKKAAGGPETFTFHARYIQTKAQVGAGDANGSAVLTFSYL